tara:strand:- start:5321 stop:5590 length:270 start_codon:yes stop_codon:yes gene_type:complete
MCRNIRTLYNFDPPATESEIQAAALQFVRKVSGFNKPSQANEAAFVHAVTQISLVAADLLNQLETKSPAKNREAEKAKSAARNQQRFGG